MNERVWVKHGWTTIMCALVLLHVCLGQKDCTGVDCPHLDNCIEEVLEDGACCATCSQRGCICKGYQYYDCNSAGFKKGKVPEGESYLVDSGSTECWCPAGGGNISCRFIPCPDVPPHCIELSDSTEACSHCLRLGCVHHNHKYEAGHSFHMDPCQVCHCPNEGGELMCSVIPDCSSEMAKNPEVKKNELHVSKHEHPDDFLSEEHKLPSNSMPKYTENRSEFEEEEDYDYFPEATASPYTFVSSSATLQTQNPHEVLHEDTREELRETLGTYEVESRKEETEDSLNSPITETDSRSYQKLSQTETIARHTQVPPRKITTITTDDIQRTERNPDPYRDLHHTIPELNTLPKLQFISTTKPPVNVREREAHRQPQILGRYHQEGNGLHLTSNNQRDGKMKHIKKRTLSCLEEALLCSGAALLHLAQGVVNLCRVTMKSEDYQGILERNVLASVRKLGLNRRSWVLQQDNDPKHTAKNTQEWLRGKHWTILKWPSMNPDLNPIEHLWKELKHAVWKRRKQLEQFAHEEWARIPAERCRCLTDSYRNRLIAVIVSKGCATKY